MGISVSMDDSDGLDFLRECIQYAPSGSKGLIIEFYNVMDSCVGGTDTESARRIEHMVGKLRDMLEEELIF